MDFAGVFAALTTPYASDGSVSLAHLKHNIEKYNRTGLKGYVVLGSTGEAVLLSRAEMERILAVAKESAAKEKLLIAGAGAESTAETIERSKLAGAAGYHAVLVKTPSYYKPLYKPDVLIAHFRRVADASPVPVLLYSIPQYTGIALEASEVAALAEHPNIIGIKDSSGHVQRIVEMVAAVPNSFQILVGSASTVFPSLMVGARGAILALASALPEKCVELFDVVRGGDLAKAREMQRLMVPASKLIVSQSGTAGLKFAMDQLGYRGGLPRLPLQPLGEEQKSAIREVLSELSVCEPARLSGTVSV